MIKFASNSHMMFIRCTLSSRFSTLKNVDFAVHFFYSLSRASMLSEIFDDGRLWFVRTTLLYTPQLLTAVIIYAVSMELLVCFQSKQLCSNTCVMKNIFTSPMSSCGFGWHLLLTSAQEQQSPKIYNKEIAFFVFQT